MKIKVAIIDDNVFLIKSIVEKLSFFENISVAFTAINGADCIEKIKQKKIVDLILMDISMPICDGILATYKIKQLNPKIKIVILTVFDDDENIFSAIKSGADGYLLKETSPEDLYNAIIKTMEGGAIMTPSIAMKTLNLLRNFELEIDEKSEDRTTVILSKREIEVLEQLSKGFSYSAIAENLFLAPSTIRKHIENIYKKLQVHSKIEAIIQAKKKRII